MGDTAAPAWMRRALQLAAAGPWPDANPRVGCVLVASDGTVVGEGFHHGAGTPHAEVEALQAAGDAARGATAYVTLEPCSHTGRTGPCSDALLRAGVVRVVFAQSDPNVDAAGGAERLHAAGVQVTGGVLADEAAALNDRWARTVALGRPLVTWKLATTLDGRSAAADGSSQWITGEAARADVHLLRASRDAVLVGTGTVLADDPRLTVRMPDGAPAERQPVRVVMGLRDVPPAARLRDAPGEVVHLATHEPREALEALWVKGIRDVWLEGGPTLAAAFLRAGLVDDVYAYVAPALLGSGSAAVADLGIGSIEGLQRLELVDVEVVGGDVRIHAEVPTGGPTRAENPTHHTADHTTHNDSEHEPAVSR
ncbi:bifunctional diaminohydroxyphosphoribosylaminopyrimidine deaminase/5-amino-6-(5-phosphoribosylamino)uracil reductase RibD [Terrabacter sp. MAHUQ-38]|uniref:bifunctional diaminohydroxyphosphoribosylaminopyrimidine deaminase/5-amino-6-(5-phosphoribosylamino)uracil reductase RibD n=1 Tax=unclassified Terrabacter TaxID=2630222 RepID=UPI00165E1733|nr:bifunctional diaminohydroxyphosphoribosylaminopyrimidine deaminase/5-amino-6-(5-phosphoribosylamino)uracil reductase RibD [Terrabacter sp. MAHUQ-38]MBC9823258.1 bifunctional diaminohydroxyphosphoribosylaminopyrimidine deaminase/5-amino-6-(5-phosphoribosylamino)uracil reductase RibD [Terrabacter sp. MAHUQ-38]